MSHGFARNGLHGGAPKVWERLEVELDQDWLNLLGPFFWMTIASQKRQTQLWCRGILELLHKEMVYSIKDFTALACEKFLGLIELDVNTRTWKLWNVY